MSNKKSELQFFKDVWAHWHLLNATKCVECGQPLKFHPAHVSHILSKGAYPKFRLNPLNVKPLCLEHHQQYETGKRSEMKIYKFVSELSEKLKAQYYED